MEQFCVRSLGKTNNFWEQQQFLQLMVGQWGKAEIFYWIAIYKAILQMTAISSNMNFYSIVVVT